MTFQISSGAFHNIFLFSFIFKFPSLQKVVSYETKVVLLKFAVFLEKLTKTFHNTYASKPKIFKQISLENAKPKINTTSSNMRN